MACEAAKESVKVQMIEKLEEILKHKFRHPDLLMKALTHGSINPHVSGNYERLEFLGDRVLGVSIASLLYQMFPSEPEGSLSQRFTGLVCKETVAMVAQRLHLDEYMVVASEDIRQNENVLCDVCEAVIGAIYIDGGVDGAIEFVNEHWKELIDKRVAPPKDTKSALQELAHAKGLGAPIYRVVERKGSEHNPLFFVGVSLTNMEEQVGQGHSKKLAEFDAAAKMLEKIK